MLGQGSWRQRQWRYRQEFPYDIPSPYRAQRREITDALAINTAAGGSVPPWANAWVSSSSDWQVGSPVGLDHPMLVDALGMARKKFIGLTGEFANAAHALLERKQTMDMLTHRLTAIYQWARAVKRGRFRDAAIALQTHQRREGKGNAVRANSREIATAWFQWWFGLSPLLKDIASAMEILESPFEEKVLKARITWVPGKKESTFFSPGTFGYNETRLREEWWLRARVQAVVRIDNPNLYLRSRLGFTNPFILAYEVVPFSFVANWFVNIEEWLGQFSDLHGLKVEEAFHSVTYKRKCTTFDLNYWWPWYISDPALNGFGHKVAGYTSETRRVLGIPGVTLGVRPPWDLSKSRAMTAASLLVQRFIKELK